MPGYREITVEGRQRRPQPAVRAAAGDDWRGAVRTAVSGAVALCRRSPGTVLGSLIVLGAAGFVCVNALGHQSGRHPAPILPKIAAREAAGSAPSPVGDVAKEPLRGAAVFAPASKQATRDAIGDLIRADETTASVTPKAGATKSSTGKVPSAKPDPAGSSKPTETSAEQPVLLAQRALVKLGYGPVKADGAMGPATRAAIERFERDRKLPVTGEVAGRTLRALAPAAGKG